MTWHAANYSDNATWHAVGTDATGTPGPEGPQWPTAVEDPYVWRDAAGVLHALAHAFSPFYGVHAFVRPADVPANWSDPTAALRWTVGGAAYGNQVEFAGAGGGGGGGGRFAFSRRERPHLIWAKGGFGRSPIALSNGVEYGARANTPGEDAIFTLVQPLRTAAAAAAGREEEQASAAASGRGGGAP